MDFKQLQSCHFYSVSHETKVSLTFVSYSKIDYWMKIDVNILMFLLN